MAVDWAQVTPVTAICGGVLIGLSAALFVLANGRIAGISGLLGSLFSTAREGLAEKTVFLLGLLVTPLVWGVLAPLPALEVTHSGWRLAVAGFLVGIGSRYASGCTSGHGVCGLARLSPRSLVATLCFMSAGMMTVYAFRHLWSI